MFKNIVERRNAARRHGIAMSAARKAYSNAVIYGDGVPTTDDVINLTYGSHGFRLTDTEAHDALAAVFADNGRRFNSPTA
ncbi:hypothetical protein ABT282_15955 [Streptomyces sp. NPDC000927]|uniref:hypothetical protein n=1 Tax=Streptomyces sp. NPDC000927 TaxID=3154371 RepID=UPI00332E703B